MCFGCQPFVQRCRYLQETQYLFKKESALICVIAMSNYLYFLWVQGFCLNTLYRFSYDIVFLLPPKGIPTLTQWWGLRSQMILRAMLVVAQLLVGRPMSDRSKVMTQTKRDTLVLQVGSWASGWQPVTVKRILPPRMLIQLKPILFMTTLAIG